MSITGVNLSGYQINSLFDYFKPSTNEHNLIFNFDKYVASSDENGNAQILISGVTNGEIFDYVSFGDNVYCGNGKDDNFVISGTDSRLWGIEAPDTAPTVGVGSSGLLSGDYQYVYAYVNSTSTHISNGSPVSSVVSPSSQKVNLSNIKASTDPQVDKINLYRTTDGGSTFLYLDQINNGTTTYEDNTTDANLGTTQAPQENYRAPAKFLGVHEWDGVIWGFPKNSTILYRSNNESETVLGEGLAQESFSAFNFYNLQAKIFGICKSPTMNELWVHTSKGIYAAIKTYVLDAPYEIVLRNSEWYSISHKALKNIDAEQWGIGRQGKIFSMNTAGGVNYESYLIEPTISGEGNIAAYVNSVAINYSTGEYNQYRVICAQTGQSTPNRMFCGNYRQRIPIVEGGYLFCSWELHNIPATAMTTFENESRELLIYIGTKDGKIKRINYGTNDDGEAIDYSFTLGWTRTQTSAFQHCLLKKIMAYLNSTGNYVISALTSFDFGSVTGQVYPITIISEGALWDTAVWDEDVWGGDSPLILKEIDMYGDYKFVEVTFYGNGLNEVFEMHTMSFLFNPIEGFRGK